MSMSNWIKDAVLIPEGRPYLVDASGRVIVPAHLRAKFGINFGDKLDYYTTFANGRWFICIAAPNPEEEKNNEENL